MAQEEHRAIVEAARQGDAKEASEIMKAHVTNAGQGIIAYFYAKLEPDV